MSLRHYYATSIIVINNSLLFHHWIVKLWDSSKFLISPSSLWPGMIDNAWDIFPHARLHTYLFDKFKKPATFLHRQHIVRVDGRRRKSIWSFVLIDTFLLLSHAATLNIMATILPLEYLLFHFQWQAFLAYGQVQPFSHCFECELLFLFRGQHRRHQGRHTI